MIERTAAESDSDSFSGEPFFVVGAVRSGTTLLRLLLGHHPEICRCEEMEYLTPALTGVTEWPEVDGYRRFLAGDRGFRLSGYAMPQHTLFPEIARDFLAQRRKIDARRRVGAVVHNHFDELPRLWPDAKYVFLNRDPRDVALSCVQMGWAGTPWYGATKWIDAQMDWARLCARVPESNRMALRFEDLLERPEEELERVCRFLGVRFDPIMLEIDADTTYSRPSRSESRSWREAATGYQIAQVEARIGERLLSSAGYVASGVPPLRQSPGARIKLRLEEARGRVGFRIRRYGFGLWMLSLIAHRLPFRGFRERTQERIDAIQNLHMK